MHGPESVAIALLTPTNLRSFKTERVPAVTLPELGLSNGPCQGLLSG